MYNNESVALDSIDSESTRTKSWKALISYLYFSLFSLYICRVCFVPYDSPDTRPDNAKQEILSPLPFLCWVKTFRIWVASRFLVRPRCFWCIDPANHETQMTGRIWDQVKTRRRHAVCEMKVFSSGKRRAPRRLAKQAH